MKIGDFVTFPPSKNKIWTAGKVIFVDDMRNLRWIEVQYIIRNERYEPLYLTTALLYKGDFELHPDPDIEEIFLRTLMTI